jgi:hypothetical protein
MKVKDVPQTGKLGLTVTWPGRNGLLRRTLVTPRNPRSGAQQVIRQSLSTQAAAYDQLTDPQQEAWIAAAAQIKSKPSLGQSGPITNTAGAIALKLHTTDAPPEGTMLRAGAPQNSGRRRGVGYRVLGTLNTPANGYCDITSAYTGRFGMPAVGKRVFVSVNANVDGFEGIPLAFSARVPASA